jgi:hypothetical protein
MNIHAPKTPKGEPAKHECGDIHVVPVTEGPSGLVVGKELWMAAGQFCSPVFGSGGGSVYALQLGNLIKISADGKKIDNNNEIRGLEVLIGFDGTRRLVALQAEGAVVVDMKTGDAEWLKSDEDQRSKVKLAYLRGWERDYPGVSLKPKLNGSGVWGIIVAKDADQDGTPVCSDCTQPSYSPEAKTIVFVTGGAALKND